MEIQTLRLQVQSLQLQVRELKAMVYGSRGEKFISGNTEGVTAPDMFPEDKLGEHTVIKTTLVQYEKKKIICSSPWTKSFTGHTSQGDH